jgi:hypothetical protein
MLSGVFESKIEEVAGEMRKFRAVELNNLLSNKSSGMS